MNDPADFTITADVPFFLLAKIVEHPLRRQLIQYVLDNPGKVTPVGISRALGQPLANLVYHFNILKRANAVRLVGQEPARGSTRHIYERDYLLDEHEALIVRLMKEAKNEKRWLSRKPKRSKS